MTKEGIIEVGRREEKNEKRNRTIGRKDENGNRESRIKDGWKEGNNNR